jgi:uncharacterized protein YdcH (DUF465 family)
MLIKELIQLQEGARRKDLEYKEKKVKNILDKVIVDIKGKESAKFTRLAKAYKEVKDEMDALETIRESLNDEIKEEALELFNAEDEVLTRVIETVSLTVQLSKRGFTTKTDVNYEKIITDISALVPALKDKITEIVAACTNVTKTPRSPALTVKVNEGVIGSITSFAKKFMMNVLKWCKGYDAKLDKVRKSIEAL